MNILVKLPSRGRPKQCADVLMAMHVQCQDPESIECVISIDTQEDAPAIPLSQLCPWQTACITGRSDSKIHAINRDIPDPNVLPWDILVVASDDMFPVAQGWDTIIREAMALHFPDLDGMLWFPDGYTKNLCTMSIMGRRWYNRFGYVYHHSYKSEWCDNEQMEVAQAHGKMVYIDQQLFEHRHPANTKVKLDSTYTKAMTKVSEDETNYKQRRAKGFPQ